MWCAQMHKITQVFGRNTIITIIWWMPCNCPRKRQRQRQQTANKNLILREKKSRRMEERMNIARKEYATMRLYIFFHSRIARYILFYAIASWSWEFLFIFIYFSRHKFSFLLLKQIFTDKKTVYDSGSPSSADRIDSFGGNNFE